MSSRRSHDDRPALRLTPYAWAKLLWFCHAGDTEIGGFGISSEDDLLLIEDLVTVKQQVTAVSVEFDDSAVADYFERQAEAGVQPARCGRVWAHTHPGDCPEPSGTDEETFERVFGHCDWAVMLILAKGGQTYCRLRFNAGPGGEQRLRVVVDDTVEFPASDFNGWEAEYDANIEPEVIRPVQAAWAGVDGLGELDGNELDLELEAMLAHEMDPFAGYLAEGQ